MKLFILKMVKPVFNLVKCHYSYLLAKATLLILGFVLIIDVVSCFMVANSCQELSSVSQANLYYLQNNFFFMKTINLLIIVFLYSYPFTKKQDNYCTLIITGAVSRNKYFLSKVFTIALFLFAFTWLEACIYIIIGALYYPIIVLDYHSILLFVNLYLLMFYYGLIALLLIQLSDNIYMAIVPFALYIIATSLGEAEEKLAILTIILPTISIDFRNTNNDLCQIAFLIIVFLFLNMIVYHKRDF